jgi:hypothetical protein
MSDCGWLSDRMPAVALARAEWTVDEMRHLMSCQWCQVEWELVRLSSHLGEHVGAELDADSIARAVLQRLARTTEKERVRRRSWSFAAVAIAAAIAAAVWTGRPATPPRGTPAISVVTAALEIPLPELDNLEPAELNTVLQTIDEPLLGGPTNTPEAGDSYEDDFEGVLDTWEG